MNPRKFIIFAHARSGSTSLAKALQIHPSLRVAIEPFHPRYGEWNPQERSYIKFITDRASLTAALSELFTRYNGIKVLDYQLPEELYSEMLLDPRYKVILLRRRNALQAIVSGLIAEQTGVWQIADLSTRGQRVEPLQPLSLDEVSGKLRYLLETQRFYADLVGRRPDGSCLIVEYGELYTEDLRKNCECLSKVFGFLGLEMPRDGIDEFMDPRKAKINLDDTYTVIPNAREINERFGSPETGWLFEKLRG